MYNTKEIQEDVTIEQLLDGDFGLKIQKGTYDDIKATMVRESISFDNIMSKSYFRLDFHFFNELNQDEKKKVRYMIDCQYKNSGDPRADNFSDEYNKDLEYFNNNAIYRYQIKDYMIRELGPLALVIPTFLNDIYQTPLKNPDKIIFFLKMPFMTIFYVPRHKYLTVNPSKKTQSYMNKKWEELSESEIMEIMENDDDDKKKENEQRKKALYYFKTKLGVDGYASDFMWIVATPQNTLVKYFRIHPKLEELLVRCCWFPCVRRKNTIIRLLHLVIYLNCPYKYEPSAVFVIRPKKIRKEKKEKKEKKKKKKIQELENEPDYDTIFLLVKTTLEMLTNNREHIKEIKGCIEFWFMLNCILYNHTDFPDKKKVVSWKKKHSMKTLDASKEVLITATKFILKHSDFYINRVYMERPAEEEDLKMNLLQINDDPKIVNRAITANIAGSVPFLKDRHDLINASLQRPYFKVHGKLSEIE